MKKQLQDIAILLLSILLTLAYGNETVFDFSLRWHTIFVLTGVVGVVLTVIPAHKDRHDQA
ncbi:MAG: hypothetical protein LUG15_06245 [Oscillospiraceae bacterium]|nr:hypothetical protein [Oscillospiraceae bacterium]